MHLRFPWFPAGHDRVLAIAIGASIVLHGVLLSVHFKFPNVLRSPPADTRLDVVLVNAKTHERPSKAEVLAQANLDRGGSVDEHRRARSPLPVTHPKDPGRDLALAERRVRELEAKQQELLAMARATQIAVPAQAEKATPAVDTAPKPSGRDLADLSLAAMRLQAEIDRNLDAYQKRPRKQFIGASAVEYRFAQYEEDWRRKIERVGTANYPAAARGRLYGSLQMTVTLRADGNVESVKMERASGLKVLDDAAFRIVKMASPYAAFPPDIRRDTDLLVITRTWFFDRGDQLWTK